MRRPSRSTGLHNRTRYPGRDRWLRKMSVVIRRGEADAVSHGTVFHREAWKCNCGSFGCASATVCFVKHSLWLGRRNAGYGKDENDEAVSIFPTTPATTTTGLIRLFLKARTMRGVGERRCAAAPHEPWR